MGSATDAAWPLLSIRQNCTSAHVVASDLGLEARSASLSTTSLPERTDQSTWPAAARGDDGVVVCTKGPHNIIRTSCEFALEELHGCDVYLGSPTEIAATLYAHASSSVDAGAYPVADDLMSCRSSIGSDHAADASDFIDIAHGIIEVSGAHRSSHTLGLIQPLE